MRRAIRNARLHLPAPFDTNGAGGRSSDVEDACASPSVAYASLRDDRRERRSLPEDVSGLHFVIEERTVAARKKGHVAALSSDEQRRAADAWARLQTLYGLFRELDAASDDDTESSDSESFHAEKKQPKQQQETKRRRRRDDGLRSLLQEVQLPSGVILRDLRALSMTEEGDDNAMPHGFTAGMFAALGNAIYKEMMVAAEQNRISPESFEELGNCLYADATSVTVSATA